MYDRHALRELGLDRTARHARGDAHDDRPRLEGVGDPSRRFGDRPRLHREDHEPGAAHRVAVGVGIALARVGDHVIRALERRGARDRPGGDRDRELDLHPGGAQPRQDRAAHGADADHGGARKCC
jgi:hypothetical protein